MSGIIKIDSWDEIFLGKNLYELTPENRFIAMTGSFVIEDLLFRFPYRLTKIEWKRTNNATPPVDVTGIMSFRFRKSTLSGVFLDIIENYIVASDGQIIFGDGFEYSANILRLEFSATNTTRVWPTVTIQRLN